MNRKMWFSVGVYGVGALIVGMLIWGYAGNALKRQEPTPVKLPHSDPPTGGSTSVDRASLSNDPDRHFLQDVADHEEAMLRVTRTLLQRGLANSLRDHVFALSVRHEAETAKAIEILKSSYSIDWKPSVKPEYVQPINGVLSAKAEQVQGRLAEFSRWHEGQELNLVKSFLPLLTNAEAVRFARRLGTSPGSKTPLLPTKR